MTKDINQTRSWNRHEDTSYHGHTDFERWVSKSVCPWSDVFSCLFQKRVWLTSFVTPWALMKSVTLPFIIWELCSVFKIFKIYDLFFTAIFSTNSFTYYHQDAEQTNFLIKFLYCIHFLLLFRLLAMRPLTDSLFWSRRFAIINLQPWLRVNGCVTMDTTRHLHLFSAVTTLKGEFQNPSAHDQTCFHVCFRNGFD